MSYLVSVFSDTALSYPDEKPYHPSEIYPELKSLHSERLISVRPNAVYAAVRSSLHLLGLDAAHYGTDHWNPLGDYIQPGDQVVIKPNLVIHDSGSLVGQNCLTTHGSVVRPILDYAYLALKGKGRACIADAPLQSARFDQVCRDNGLTAIQSFYRQAYGYELEILDLRQVAAVKDDRSGFISHQAMLPGDPLGYAPIDLGTESLLEPLMDNDGSRFAVTDYVAEDTRARHAKGRHEYVISRSILSADCVIALPKLKVHEKVGITTCLKLTVGIVGSKDCLPHFRSGSPEVGGDEYPRQGKSLATIWTAVRTWAQGRVPMWLWRFLRSGGKAVVRSLTQVRGILPSDASEPQPFVVGGAWYGNDTAWRMVTDLNCILIYADRSGRLCKTPQRKYFALVDGVICGEDKGPLAPTPRPLGLIVSGDNAWAVDVVCASLVGFNWRSIKMFSPSLYGEGWLNDQVKSEWKPPGVELVSNDPAYSTWADLKAQTRYLRPSPGWLGHIELEC